MIESVEIDSFFQNISFYVSSLEKFENHQVLNKCFQHNQFSSFDTYLQRYIYQANLLPDLNSRKQNLMKYRLFALLGTYCSNFLKFYLITLDSLNVCRMDLANSIIREVFEISKPLEFESLSGKQKSTCMTFTDSQESCSLLEYIITKYSKCSKEVAIVISDASCQYESRASSEIYETDETLMIRTDFYNHLQDDIRTDTSKIQFLPNLTVYRGCENDGFRFLQSPKIIQALYTCPLERNKIEHEKFKEKNKEKIESLFQLAIKKNINCLIFQAFGCKEKKEDDPKEILEIFVELIDKYTSHFELICFAISRTSIYSKVFGEVFGKYDNPRIFSREECKYKTDCQEYYNEKHTSSYIHPKMCRDKGKCDKYHDEKSSHRNIFWHPPFCRFEPKCNLDSLSYHLEEFIHTPRCKEKAQCQQLNDKGHCAKYKHPPLCKEKGLCALYYDKNDPGHKESFIHPQPCRYRGICSFDFEADHLLKWMHPIKCKHGLHCKDKEFEHGLHYSHISNICPSMGNCIMSKDIIKLKEHFRIYSHPIYPLCKNEPNCKEKSKTDHTRKFSHFCLYGKDCRSLKNQLKDNNHLREYLHINRKFCFTAKCELVSMDLEHINEYIHLDSPIIQLPCKHGVSCKYYEDTQHIRMYFHPVVENVAINPSGVNASIDFDANMNNHLLGLDYYFTINKLPQPDKLILDYINNLRPCHRCKVEVFKLIIDHGCLMSKKRQYYFASSPIEATLEEVRSDQGIAQLLMNENHYFSHKLFQWIRSMLETKLCKSHPHLTNNKSLSDCQKIESELEKEFLKKFSKELLAKIKLEIDNKIKLALNFKFLGINNTKDSNYGTEAQVFGMYGQHRWSFYGDILFILKKDIIHHPDFDFSVLESVVYSSQDYITQVAPWLSFNNNLMEWANLYKKTKVNCSKKDWEVTTAKIMMAKVHNFFLKVKNINKTAITPEDILYFEQNANSYYLFECHMPDLIPLSFVKKIIIPKVHYNTLTKEQQARLQYLFRNKTNAIHVYNTEGDPYEIEKVSKFFLEKEPNSHKSGYCFSSVAKFGMDCFLPLNISKTPLTIYFQAKGFDIHVSLSKTLTATLNSNSNDYVHFVLNERDSYKRWYKPDEEFESYATFTHNYTHGKKNLPIQKQSVVRHNYDCQHHIGYLIKVRMDKSNLLASIEIDERWMKRKNIQMNNNMVSVNLNNSMQFSFVSFSSWSKPIYVKNLMIV